MVRGGARINAGAKPKWKTGKTKTIRVPEFLAEHLLDYAKKCDQCPSLILSESSKVLNLSGILIHTLNNKKFVYISDLIKLGYDIKPSRLALAVSLETNS